MNQEIRVKNAKLKREYSTYLSEAVGNSERTVDQKMGMIKAYEDYFDADLTKRGKKDSFVKYKNHLKNERSLGLNAFKNHCHAIREFYLMLSLKPGFKRTTNLNDLQYLNITKNEKNAIRTSATLKEMPTIKQFKRLVDSIDITSEVDMRDKAIAVFLLFAPTRVGTIISLRLKHLNQENLIVVIDPTKDVSTKKNMGNWGKLLIFEPEYLCYFTSYVDYLTKKKGFSEDEPLFPRSLAKMKGENNFFTHDELSREPLKSTKQIRDLLKKYSEKNKIKIFTPHRYRDLHFYLARKCCVNEEQRNAVEKNLGHRGITTAQIYYGNIDKYERFEILNQIDFSKHDQVSRLNLRDIELKIDRLEYLIVNLSQKISK